MDDRSSTKAGPALAGFGYGTFLFLWALASAGFGHGTFLPAGLVNSPLSPFFRVGIVAAPFWWAAIGYAIGRRSGRGAVALIALHALGAMVCLFGGTPWESSRDQWTQLGYAGRVMPHIVWPGFAVYLAGLVVACRFALRQMEARA